MMAKAKRKPRIRKIKAFEAGDLPTVEQLRNGDWQRDFITHADTATKAMAYRRKDSSIVEKWLRDEPNIFPQPSQRVIADCVLLWSRVGSPNLVAQYGERLAHTTASQGYTQQEALDTLHRYKTLLGPHMRHYWAVWENVLRHNEPAGVAGSAFAKNPAQKIQSAKMIVAMVAGFLAGKLGY